MTTEFSIMQSEKKRQENISMKNQLTMEKLKSSVIVFGSSELYMLSSVLFWSDVYGLLSLFELIAILEAHF